LPTPPITVHYRLADDSRLAFDDGRQLRSVAG
jgi:hypothetical protein